MTDYIVLLFLVLLIIFNMNITQALPQQVQQIMRNPVVKLSILILIFFFSISYPALALLLLIAYILCHTYCNTSNASDNIVAMSN